MSGPLKIAERRKWVVRTSAELSAIKSPDYNDVDAMGTSPATVMFPKEVWMCNRLQTILNSTPSSRTAITVSYVAHNKPQ